MLTQGGSTPASRLDYAFQVVLSRDIAPDEKKVLLARLDRDLAHFKTDEADAKKLDSVGDHKDPANLTPDTVAAYTVVASMILNLDETITKE